MHLILVGFLYLFSLCLSGETAVLLFIETFGDYFVNDAFKAEINPHLTSVATLKEQVTLKIGHKMATDLVIVGYGSQGQAGEFFAASRRVDDQTPLAQLFPNLALSPDKKWFIYFVEKMSSHVVTDKKLHVPSSPLVFLSAVAKNNLIWF